MVVYLEAKPASLFLEAIPLLHPFWSKIYPLYGGSPTADLVCYSSHMEKPPLLYIFWGAGQGELAHILPPCSESPCPSALQLGRFIFRRKARKPAKLNHRLLGCSRCCKRGTGVGWQSLCVWSPSSNSLWRS